MNSKLDQGCGCFSAEELILAAYGEAGKPDLSRHLADCPDCRRFVEEVNRLRAIVAGAGADLPSEQTLAAVREKAAEAAETRRRKDGVPGVWERSAEGVWGARFFSPATRRWLYFPPALAAGLVLAVGISIAWTVLMDRRSQPVAEKREPAAWIVGAASRLAELESCLGAGMETLGRETAAGASGSGPDLSAGPRASGEEGGTETPANGFEEMEIAFLDLEEELVPGEEGWSVEKLEEEMADLENDLNSSLLIKEEE